MSVHETEFIAEPATLSYIAFPDPITSTLLPNDGGNNIMWLPQCPSLLRSLHPIMTTWSLPHAPLRLRSADCQPSPSLPSRGPSCPPPFPTRPPPLSLLPLSLMRMRPCVRFSPFCLLIPTPLFFSLLPLSLSLDPSFCFYLAALILPAGVTSKFIFHFCFNSFPYFSFLPLTGLCVLVVYVYMHTCTIHVYTYTRKYHV